MEKYSNEPRILAPLTVLNMLNKLFFTVWSYENETKLCLNFVKTFIACMLYDKHIGENKSWMQKIWIIVRLDPLREFLRIGLHHPLDGVTNPE